MKIVFQKKAKESQFADRSNRLYYDVKLQEAIKNVIKNCMSLVGAASKY